ncbi:MAG TPA: TraR/DksA C4-type zinc finger protein [Chloroflexia bacterium]|nr:TraR/DksA C4-type zinc finger protein [Chloroflexia bacterium]
MVDTAVFHERLDAERARLLQELQHLDAEVAESADPLDPSRGGVGNHLADDANVTFEEEKLGSVRRNVEQLLAQVDHALERVAAGSYGTCENCGQPIPPERLAARPFATLCISCQQRQEGPR